MYPDGIYDFVATTFCFDHCITLKLEGYVVLLAEQLKRDVRTISPDEPRYMWHIENAILSELVKPVKKHIEEGDQPDFKIWKALEILGREEEDRHGYLMEDYIEKFWLN